MKQRKRFDKTFICNSVSSCTVCLIYIQYSHTFSISKQINLSKKNKGQQKLYDVNVRAICGCRKAGRHQTLMKKKKVLARYLQIVAMFVYISHTFFASKQIDLSEENKGCECQGYLWMQRSWQALEITEKKKSLVRHLQLSFTVCLYSHVFFTSTLIDLSKNNKGRQKLYNVNVRAIYGCRQVWAGDEHLKKLCCYLIMEPLLSNNYQNY